MNEIMLYYAASQLIRHTSADVTSLTTTPEAIRHILSGDATFMGYRLGDPTAPDYVRSPFAEITGCGWPTC